MNLNTREIQGGEVILINIEWNILYKTKNMSDISNINVSASHGRFFSCFLIKRKLQNRIAGLKWINLD